VAGTGRALVLVTTPSGAWLSIVTSSPFNFRLRCVARSGPRAAPRACGPAHRQPRRSRGCPSGRLPVRSAVDRHEPNLYEHQQQVHTRRERVTSSSTSRCRSQRRRCLHHVPGPERSRPPISGNTLLCSWYAFGTSPSELACGKSLSVTCGCWVHRAAGGGEPCRAGAGQRRAAGRRGAGRAVIACSAGHGAKGRRLYDWTQIKLAAPTTAGMARWLLVRRSHSDGELAFYACYGPAATPLIGLVRVAGIRWAIEEASSRPKARSTPSGPRSTGTLPAP
jgi:hypothetical protein